MYKLTNYLRSYKKESVIAPAFKMLEASFELFVPLVMAKIVDEGIKNQDINYILKMGLVLVGLAIIGLTCSIIAQYFAAKAAMGFGQAIRKDLFSHINKLSYTEIDQVGTSTLITRMTNDINQMQSGVNMFLRLFLRSPFIVFGAMIMAFVVNARVAVIFVIAIPLLSIVVFGIMLYSIPLYQKVQKALDHVLLMTRENLVGTRVIRAFCRQEDEKEAYREGSDALYKIQSFVGKVSSIMNPATYIIVNVALIAILWTGAIQVENGIISQGEVIAEVNYMSQILIELVKLANLIILLTKAMACSKRVGEVFCMEPSIVAPERTVLNEEQKSDYTVEFRNVTFGYSEGAEPVLHEISFAAKKGECIGVIGGTGCGKTTLINLIPRFYDASEGEILLDGVDIKSYAFSDLRNMIGIVPQKAVLFHGSIEDNLKWGKEDATEEEMKRAIEIAQGKDVIDSKKDGMKEVILQGGKNLSGGQRQRLTIARALVKLPRILILDDSSSALDFATDAKLRASIKENITDSTVFIVSQRASTIKHADTILVLDDGRLVGKGTHDELLCQCDVYKEIVNSQTDQGQQSSSYKQKGGHQA